MPKLPNPQEIGRTTLSPGGPAGKLQADMIGTPKADTSIGDALMGLGEEAYRFAQKEKNRMDQVAIDNAKNKYRTKEMDLQAKYLLINGENAVNGDLVKTFGEERKKISEGFSKTFKNNEQRELWNSFDNTADVNFRAGVLNHTLRESDNFAKTTHTSRLNVNTLFAQTNFSDDKIVDEMKTEMVESLAREGIRSGWSAERITDETNKAFAPFWGGIATQFINAKQYDKAGGIIEKYKDVFGDDYGKYKKLIDAGKIEDTSQANRDEIMNNPKLDTWKKRFDHARGNLTGDLETKTISLLQDLEAEERGLKIREQQAQNERDLKWMSTVGTDAMINGTLTNKMIENSGLSDELVSNLKTSLHNQGVEQKTATGEKESENTYAQLAVKIKLTPNEITQNDIAKFVGTGPGQIDGNQFISLVEDLEKMKKAGGNDTTSAKAESRGLALIKAMGERGDFGDEKKNAETYTNLVIAYRQKFIEEPNVDHLPWLQEEIKKENINILKERLDSDWKGGIFNDDREEIAKDFLKERGEEPTEENIRKVLEEEGRGMLDKRLGESVWSKIKNLEKRPATEEVRHSIPEGEQENQKFNPEGTGYDYESAKSAGMSPDETGHWPSRNPETGQILKGVTHETFKKTIDGEKEAGYDIYKFSDGKYYSFKTVTTQEEYDALEPGEWFMEDGQKYRKPL